MAHIIALANQKGGKGKTTTAINLGAALAEAGKFCLLLDFDPQANATSGLGVEVTDQHPTVYDVLINNRNIRDAIVSTSHRDFHIVPSSPALSGANIDLVSLPRREYRLYDTLLEVRNDYDYILIDSPPSLGLLTVNSLVASDSVLVPVQSEFYAIEGLSQLLRTVNLIKRNLKPDLEILGALLTMYEKRIKLSQEVMWELRDNFPHFVFETMIPRNVRLAEAPSFGETIFRRAPLSKGAVAYKRLANELLNSEEKNKR